MDLDRSPEQLIKAGLAALKQKDYGRAIATFQQLRQTEHISTSYRIKAQMGLIQTYEAQGNHGQAQILCSPCWRVVVKLFVSGPTINYTS